MSEMITEKCGLQKSFNRGMIKDLLIFQYTKNYMSICFNATSQYAIGVLKGCT